MEFTYEAYAGLISSLKQNDYAMSSYHDYHKRKKSAILRHDVDNSLEKAVLLAELESRMEVRSTYFVLLATDFYNPASKRGKKILRHIRNLGHEIGLHFDETAYGGAEEGDIIKHIRKEAVILSDILELEIKTVSMHRPSNKTLGGNLYIDGLINSYGTEFFNDFKYISDSRRFWREPVEQIIHSGQYNRLHILTHAFWYNEREKTMRENVIEYVNSANKERYQTMMDNIRDLRQIMDETEVLGW